MSGPAADARAFATSLVLEFLRIYGHINAYNALEEEVREGTRMSSSQAWYTMCKRTGVAGLKRDAEQRGLCINSTLELFIDALQRRGAASTAAATDTGTAPRDGRTGSAGAARGRRYVPPLNADPMVDADSPVSLAAAARRRELQEASRAVGMASPQLGERELTLDNLHDLRSQLEAYQRQHARSAQHVLSSRQRRIGQQRRTMAGAHARRTAPASGEAGGQGPQAAPASAASAEPGSPGGFTPEPSPLRAGRREASPGTRGSGHRTRGEWAQADAARRRSGSGERGERRSRSQHGADPASAAGGPSKLRPIRRPRGRSPKSRVASAGGAPAAAAAAASAAAAAGAGGSGASGPGGAFAGAGAGAGAAGGPGMTSAESTELIPQVVRCLSLDQLAALAIRSAELPLADMIQERARKNRARHSPTLAQAAREATRELVESSKRRAAARALGQSQLMETADGAGPATGRVRSATLLSVRHAAGPGVGTSRAAQRQRKRTVTGRKLGRRGDHGDAEELSSEFWIPLKQRARMLRRQIRVQQANAERAEKQEVLHARSATMLADLDRAKLTQRLGKRVTSSCGLCELQFAVINLPLAVSYKAIMDLRESWGASVPPNPALANFPRCYDAVRVCTFCAQFLQDGQDFRASINRIVKAAIPDGVQMSREAKQAFAKAAGVFILYLTSAANDITRTSKRHTISTQDVMKALDEVDFSEFVAPLEQCLAAYRPAPPKRAGGSRRKARDGGEEAGAAAAAEGATPAAGADGGEEVDGDEEAEGGVDEEE